MSENVVADRGVPPGYELLGPTDQETVRGLVLRGADMRRPQHVFHSLLFPSAPASEGARKAAETAGWQVSITDPDGVEGAEERWKVTCEKQEYVLLARLIHADTQFFDRLARTGGGENDGWDASVS